MSPRQVRGSHPGRGALIGILVGALVTLGLAAIKPDMARAEAGFVPHRAVYGLTLASSRSGSSAFTQAVGKLEFRWADVCDGWAVNQRTHINLIGLDGQEVQFGWTLSSWESKDGLQYRFFIRRLQGEGETEELRGQAQLSSLNGPGEAVYQSPEGLTVELPAGTVFPTHHSLSLLDAAGRGAFPIWRIVFDGAGDEGLFGINAALVQVLPPSAESSFGFPLLRDVRSWRMDMAHFALDNRSGEPAHEQSLRLYQNGIVDELLLDYGDFALDARLADVERLPPPDC